MKVLVTISTECNYRDSLLRIINNLKHNIHVSILEPINNNLIDNANNFSKKFKEDNFDIGIVIWITGVAFTNLLSKANKTKFITTVPSINYLNELCLDKLPDTLVLGFNTLGSVNLKYILSNFIEKINMSE